jgi:hypothetical protein
VTSHSNESALNPIVDSYKFSIVHPPRGGEPMRKILYSSFPWIKLLIIGCDSKELMKAQ